MATSKLFLAMALLVGLIIFASSCVVVSNEANSKNLFTSTSTILHTQTPESGATTSTVSIQPTQTLIPSVTTSEPEQSFTVEIAHIPEEKTATQAPPGETPTPISTSPQDPALDIACRQTISDFFSLPCDDWQALRELYIPSHQIDTMPAELSCNYVISRTLLQVVPVSEWWQQQHPDQRLPVSMWPTTPNEYVYYVVGSTRWKPNVSVPVDNPYSLLMFMVVDENNTCKIRDHGW